MKRFFEPALSIGLVISLVIGARADVMQKDISERVLRLHVIANSDSEADQAEKLVIRDIILNETDTLLKDAKSVSDVKTIVSQNLDVFVKRAQSATSRPVRAELTTMHFPTREYDTFTLPAGEYEALRIIIGEGDGRNWWCVMFPPLCLSAAETVSCAEEAGMSDDEINFISGGETEYRYEFKFLEILSAIMEKVHIS